MKSKIKSPKTMFDAIKALDHMSFVTGHQRRSLYTSFISKTHAIDVIPFVVNMLIILAMMVMVGCIMTSYIHVPLLYGILYVLILALIAFYNLKPKAIAYRYRKQISDILLEELQYEACTIDLDDFEVFKTFIKKIGRAHV